MSLLDRVDAALLRVVDGAVLWLWNTFEAPRILSIRICMIGTVLFLGLRLALEGASIAGGIMMVIVLFLGVVEETAAAMYSPRQLNARLLASRPRPGAMFTRFLALTGPLPPYRDHAGLEIAMGAFTLAFIWLTFALAPEGPPRPRRRERLAAQPSPT